jgi:hypothetical protein
MPTESRPAYFRSGYEIVLPAGEAEDAVTVLAMHGLVRFERREFVRCVNPQDPDRRWARGDCSGRVYLDSGLDEDDRDYRCPDCGRTVYPSKKQKTQTLVLTPVPTRMGEFLLDYLKEAKFEVEAFKPGLFRIPGDAGNVEVCLADVCTWAEVFDDNYSNRDSLVFVVGNEDLRLRLPEWATTFSLAQLAIDEGYTGLVAALTALVAKASGSRAVGPGLRKPRLAPTREVAAADKEPPWAGAVRVTVPPGTSWNQITIYSELGDSATIKAPGHPGKRYSIQELGMGNQKTKGLTKRWKLLLKLCEARGSVVSFKDLGYMDFDLFKVELSRLRKNLQFIFGLDTDPIQTCSREEGVKVAFIALPDAPGSDPYVGEKTWGNR